MATMAASHQDGVTDAEDPSTIGRSSGFPLPECLQHAAQLVHDYATRFCQQQKDRETEDLRRVMDLQLSKKTMEVEDLRQALDEHICARSEAGVELENTKSTFERKLGDLENSLARRTKEAKGLKSDLAAQAKEKAQLKNERSKLASQLKAAHEESEREKEAATDYFGRLELTTDKLSNVIDKHEKQKAENTRIRTELEATQKKAEQCKADADSIRNELHTVRETSGKEIVELRERLDSKEAELANLHSEVDDTQKQLDSKEAELAAVRDVVCTAQKHLNSNEVELAKAVGELCATSSEVADVRGELETMKKQLDNKNAQLGDALGELHTTTKQLDDRDTEIADVRRELGAKNQQYKKDVDYLRGESDVASDTIAKQGLELDTKKEEVENQQAANKEVRTALDVAYGNIERSKAEATEARKQIGKEKVKAAESHNELLAKCKKLRANREELHANRKELHANRKELKRIEDELTAMKVDVARAEYKLKLLREEHQRDKAQAATSATEIQRSWESIRSLTECQSTSARQEVEKLKQHGRISDPPTDRLPSPTTQRSQCASVKTSSEDSVIHKSSSPTGCPALNSYNAPRPKRGFGAEDSEQQVKKQRSWNAY